MSENSELATRFELLMVRDFFDARACEEIIAEIRSAWGGPATVYSQGASSPVNEKLRKTTRRMLSPSTTAFVRQQLLEQKGRVERHFQISLSDCEEPQFLFYKEGDFFVPHQDGNSEQLEFDHLRVRRISVVIFLSQQSPEPGPNTYCGGSLVFFDPGVDTNRKELGYHLTGETGLLVAFRSETTHEVPLVTHGERYSIVCWYK
ncbi:MAG TPA: 2OG-Fe(II) oxygenase [Pyrinomonadaceae bacterium]|nr:2OG-Fe(II) oxygenase [Pyrinomonadaceae bacterium]